MKVSNAKMACRQPSVKELNVGIRDMAKTMNARKALRQASIRQLNVSIRNLASSTAGHGASNDLIHPRCLPLQQRRSFRNRNSGQNKQRTKRNCAKYIQEALDMVEYEDTSRMNHSNHHQLAISA
jgi:hypothetical protein